MENERISQLERTVLDLGTELYRVKNQLVSMKDYHEQFVGIVDGLKKILDDKGLIHVEDFEAAIDLGNALSNPQPLYDGVSEPEIEKIKKTSH